MKTIAKAFRGGVLLFCLLAPALWPLPASANQTVVGTVSGDFTILTDADEVFEIGEGETGDEVVELIGQRVRVTGPVQVIEGVRVIAVSSYTIIEEDALDEQPEQEEEPEQEQEGQ